MIHPDLDLKILSEIQKDGKIPLREIGAKLGLSTVTVMNHIRRLEREGIITGYHAAVDFEKLGYGIHAIIELKISKGKLIELEKRISKLPNVYAVYDTTGVYDATVITRFKSTRSLDQFVKKIQTFEFIENTNTKIVLNTIKEGHMDL